jgi:mercuric ion binding protein
MKKRLPLIALAVAFATPIFAATQTVTLSVPGMTCSACPFTVKQALNKVKGVSKTEVSYENKQAVVSFDDTQTNVQALTKATADAGYPSTARQ